MRRIRYGSYILFNLIRLTIIKVLSGFKFQAKAIQLIAPSSSIDIGNNGNITITGRLHTEPRVFLSARDGGHLKIEGAVFINRNTIIVCRDHVVIQKGVTIGPNVTIYDHDHDMHTKGNLLKQPVEISEGAWIGAGSIILKGVQIGKGAVVAAGSIVTKSVPENTIYYNEIIPKTKVIK